MTGLIVSVLCAAAVGGGLATLVLMKNSSSYNSNDDGDHQRKEEELQHRLAVVETKLTELIATVSMRTTMTTGTDTVSSSNRRLILGNKRDPSGAGLAERYKNFKERSAVVLDDLMVKEEEAAPLPDNDLVCTPLRAWVLMGIFDDETFTVVESNRTVRFSVHSLSEEHNIHTHTRSYFFLVKGNK